MMASRIRERGSMAVEIAVATPVLIVILLLIAGAGRIVQAKGHVDAAAREAARSASIVRDLSDVERAISQAAARNLGAYCAGAPAARRLSGASDWRSGGSITVEVSCDVKLAGFAPVFPSTITVESTASAPLETYKRYSR